MNKYYIFPNATMPITGSESSTRTIPTILKYGNYVNRVANSDSMCCKYQATNIIYNYNLNLL
jgi:hypothetical protein